MPTWIARVWFGMALGCVLSCSEGGPEQPATGTLGLRCESPVEVGEVSYTVARSGASVRAGTFVLRKSGKDGFSATIGPLPAGDDYSIELHANELEPRAGEDDECSGEGGFSIAPEQTTVVTVPLSCGAKPEPTANDNECPKIDSVRAVPSEATVGESLSLRADAHDPDRKLMPLKFTWTAREGVLTDEQLSRAYYMCTVAGRHAITLKISDGDDECPEESVTIKVDCRHPPTAGSGGRTLSSAGSKAP